MRVFTVRDLTRRSAPSLTVYFFALIAAATVQAQVAHHYALRAEQREEVWFPDNEHDEHVLKITRTLNGAYAEHPVHDVGDRTQHTGYSYFYLSDYSSGFYYIGDTFLKAAWRARLGSSQMRKNAGEDYGDCSILSNAAVDAKDAGKILGYPVVRVETVDNDEIRTVWIAPDLECFPLRRRVVIDEAIRLSTETTNLELLPEDTSVSLPPGIQLVSPQDFCNMHKAAYGKGFASDEICAKLERQQGQYAPKPRKSN